MTGQPDETRPADLLDARHDDPDPTGPLIDYDRLPSGQPDETRSEDEIRADVETFNAHLSDCVFCRKIASGGDEHSAVEGTAYATVVRFAPLNPVTDRHMLFVPTGHVDDASELPDVTGDVFAAAADWAQEQGCDFNLITSSGRNATQTVRHLHIHYVPRRAGDGLALPWAASADVQSLTDDASALRIENAALNEKWAAARAEVTRLRQQLEAATALGTAIEQTRDAAIAEVTRLRQAVEAIKSLCKNTDGDWLDGEDFDGFVGCVLEVLADHGPLAAALGGVPEDQEGA